MTPEEKFLDAMFDAGIPCNIAIVETGTNPKRFYVEGDKSGSKNGWYYFSLYPNPYGKFGNWKTELTQAWSDKKIHKVSLADRQRIEIEQQQQKKKQELIYQQAANKAQSIWESAAAEGGLHRYLRDKEIKPHGIRSDGFNLVIPMYCKGKLVGTQTINPIGIKKFQKGIKTTGAYFPIGEINNALYVAEGFSTGASVHEVTAEAVACAFNANNLKPVAKYLRSKHPNIEIIIAADNDNENETNTGVAAALEAALACDGAVAIPVNEENTKCDFNDITVERAKECLKKIITKERLIEMIRQAA